MKREAVHIESSPSKRQVSDLVNTNVNTPFCNLNVNAPFKRHEPVNEEELEVDVFDDGDGDSDTESVEVHAINKEKAYLINNPFLNEWPGPKTKVRDLAPKIDEIANVLSWNVIINDGTKEIMKLLVDLKNIIAGQLQNMPKDYITRLIMDSKHFSLVGMKYNRIVGGITFRLCNEGEDHKFVEIVFCAVESNQQIQGYGSRLMNQLKMWAKKEGYFHLLTYADDNAIGYFRRQGFSSDITWDRKYWDIGFLKLYDSATLMHCPIDQEVDYCEISEQVRRQRVALIKKMREISNQHLIHRGVQKNEDGMVKVEFPILETTISPSVSGFG